MVDIIKPVELKDALKFRNNDDSRVVEDDMPTAEAPKFDIPDDFPDEESFLRYAVQTYNDDVTADFLNLQAGTDDAMFAAGIQWDPVVERRRIRSKKPVLTINRLPAYIAQVVGNRLLNETTIKVLPDEGGTVEKARIRQGLIRSIEYQSNAARAYDTALQTCLISGLGNFYVDHCYSKYDVFHQDLRINRVPDFTAVVWDHVSTDPTGKDASHAFVSETISRKSFQKMYPWAQPAEFGGDLTWMAQLNATGWYTVDTVRVVSFFRMRYEKRTVILLAENGKVVDVTGQPREAWEALVAVNPTTGELYERTALRPYCEIYKLSATNILEGPTRLPCSRVPVFRVPGWEVFIGDERHRWGLVRFAKDPQRMHNFWRSVVVEKLMQTPKTKWTATKEAVQGFENAWRNSHLTDDPLLLWNGDSGAPPQMVAPAQMETALLNEASLASQDIKDVLNMHEASLGQTSNEVSGKGITARQRVSELGTVIYFNNLNAAIEECGRVLNELIPTFYDTARTIRIIGEDGKTDLQVINQPGGVDICDGHYGIVVTTGPSYTTRRVEAVESMMALQNANPEAMAPALDLMVENLDWPGAEAIAKRLKKANPLAAQEMDPGEMSPQEQQAFQQAQQKAAQDMQLAAMMQQLEIAERQAKIADLQAAANLKKAQAGKTDADAVKSVVESEHTLAQTHKLENETEVQETDPLMPFDVQARQLANRRSESEALGAEIKNHIMIAKALQDLTPEENSTETDSD